MSNNVRKLKVVANPDDFKRQHDDDAGFDLRAKKEVTLIEGKPVRVPTGVRVEIPKHHVGLLAIRSSVSLRGISLANGVGIIDSGFRGEIEVALVSLNGNQTIFENERIAQLLIVPLRPVKVEYVEKLKGSERGEGGFGSTGKK